MNRRAFLVTPILALVPTPLAKPSTSIRFKGTMPSSVHEHYMFIEVSFVKNQTPLKYAYHKARACDVISKVT